VKREDEGIRKGKRGGEGEVQGDNTSTKGKAKGFTIGKETL
jgi:hypothetical protein